MSEHTPAAHWVSEFLDTNKEVVDILIPLLSHLQKNTLVCNYGGWNRDYITEEFWRQLRSRVQGQK